MKGLKDALKNKIIGFNEYSDIASLLEKSIAGDVLDFFVEGVGRVEEIILARPYTRYAWFLAIYDVLGKVEGDKLIVYYNGEEPLWTVSTLIHEAIHVALNIERVNDLYVVLDETLAYTATFRSGALRKLYEPVNKYIVDTISNCIIHGSELEEKYILLHMDIPRILASRLYKYNYRYLVENILGDPVKALQLWLDTGPGSRELRALSTALQRIGIRIESALLDKEPCREIKRFELEEKFEMEGVDQHFKDMKKLLEKARENRERYHEILEPWWNELKDLVELEFYLEYL